MKSVWRALAVIATLAVAACNGTSGDDPKRDTGVPPGGGDKFAPCTDLATCCTDQEKLTCVGDPDSKMICTCRGLWDCSKNPKKCEQLKPVPPGGGDWNCTWEEFKYSCTKSVPPGTPPGPNPQDLPGGSNWACTFNEKEFKWECATTPPPNPTNKPEGASVWKCTVVGANLVCERTDAGVPPVGSGEWNCAPVNGVNTCTKTDNSGGLPPGGSNWKCNKVTMNGVPTWVCYGDASSNPAGNSGWVCTQVDEFGHWKCVKPEETGDIPPGGGWYVCVKGTEFGGTKCEATPTEPLPPTPVPKPGDKCIVGEKMWCDGLQYCGWGQVMCDPATGLWKTKTNDAGQVVLDCQESMAGGKRPNTVCACYHFFFNPACCERADCVVPPGTDGQICPASKGGLCDYCNPMQATTECKEPQAKCIVTNSHETFCGRLCSPSAPCPSGYQCMVVKLSGALTTNQCVPADYSCYY